MIDFTFQTVNIQNLTSHGSAAWQLHIKFKEFVRLSQLKI